MKYISTFEQFVYESINESLLNQEKINDNLTMAPSEDNRIRFKYDDSGKPKFSKPIEEVWTELWTELKPLGMTKKPGPASKFTGKNDLTLKDGTTIFWHKSSPPRRILIISTPVENAQKWKEILSRVTEVGSTDTHPHLQELWNKLPKEIQEFFKSWTRPLSANDLATGDDNQFFIDTNHSLFSGKTTNIPGLKFVSDPKTTGWDLYGRNFHYRMEPHTYNSSVRCTKNKT